MCYGKRRQRVKAKVITTLDLVCRQCSKIYLDMLYLSVFSIISRNTVNFTYKTSILIYVLNNIIRIRNKSYLDIISVKCSI